MATTSQLTTEGDLEARRYDLDPREAARCPRQDAEGILGVSRFTERTGPLDFRCDDRRSADGCVFGPYAEALFLKTLIESAGIETSFDALPIEGRMPADSKIYVRRADAEHASELVADFRSNGRRTTE